MFDNNKKFILSLIHIIFIKYINQLTLWKINFYFLKKDMEYENVIVPVEIIKNILMKIPQRSKVIELQQVSKVWKQECEKILKTLEWKSYCKKNIDEFSLCSVLSSTYLEKQIKGFHSIADQEAWKTVFDCCRNWHELPKHKLYILSTDNKWTPCFLENKDEIITCLDTWSSFIAAGSNQGNVFMFDTDDMMSPLNIIKSPGNSVKSVKFWFTEHGKLLLIRSYITSSQVLLKFWDVKNKIEVTTLKQNLSIKALCVGSANYIYGTAALFFFRCTPSRYNKELMMSHCYLSMNDFQSVKAMTSFGSTIHVIITDSTCIKLFSIKDTFDMKKKNSLELQTPHRLPELFETITENTRFYVFEDETVICIGKNLLYFITKNSESWIAHDLQKTFSGKVESLMYHASLLMIGLDRGRLLIYHVNNSKELDSSNFFKNSKPRVIDFQCDAPIVELAVTQISESPIIIAASEKKVRKICSIEITSSYRKIVRIDELNNFYE